MYQKPDPRQRLIELMAHIGPLNDQKKAILTAWEGEKKRMFEAGREEPDKPAELGPVNKMLAVYYGMKEDILREHPHLEAEFGGKRKTSQKSPLGTSPRATASKAARNARWLANRERKREENRARASRSGSGTGKGKKA